MWRRSLQACSSTGWQGSAWQVTDATASLLQVRYGDNEYGWQITEEWYSDTSGSCSFSIE